MTTAPPDLITLGRIIGGHGVRGWVKVQPFSSDSEVLSLAKHWWIGRPAGPLSVAASVPNAVFSDAGTGANTPQSVDVLWARPHGTSYLASFKGIADRNAADQLKGHSVFVSRQAFPALDPDEYYWVDLIGCTVTSDESGQLETVGVVQEILDNPAHAILSVKQQRFNATEGVWVDCLDAKDRPVFSLIPFVAAHVTSVDLATRTIATHWPIDF